MNSKFVSSLFLVCIIGTFCFAQNKKTILKNNIKSITEDVTLYENGKEYTYKESYILYNIDGKVLVETCNNKNGILVKKETYKYDNENNKTEETCYNKKEAEQEQKMQIKNSRTTFKYNAHKDKTEEVEYDSNNKVLKKVVYVYNNNGEKSCETCYDISGKIKKKVNYMYNSKNLRTKRESFRENNTLESVKNYTYEYY